MSRKIGLFLNKILYSLKNNARGQFEFQKHAGNRITLLILFY